MPSMLARFLDDTTGATAIEYALIAGLLSISILSILFAIRSEVDDMYDSIESAVQDANS